ncbi:hypothetical protein GCM10023259_014390 [Thermocatellispora tengchongensis]
MELGRWGFQAGAPGGTGPAGVRTVGNDGDMAVPFCAAGGTTGTTEPRGGVPVRSGPAAAAEKEQREPRHGR